MSNFNSIVTSLMYDYCPICNKIMKDFSVGYDKVTSDYCSNGCYSFDYRFTNSMAKLYVFSFFDINIYIKEEHDDNYRIKLKSSVEEKIKYWKENERYLAEILTR